MLAASGVAQFGAGMLADHAGSGGRCAAGPRRSPAASTRWYVAFDMDALDEAGGWAVMMPEPDGLSLETALEAVRIAGGERARSSASARPRSGSGRAAIRTRTTDAVAALAEAALAPA